MIISNNMHRANCSAQKFSLDIRVVRDAKKKNCNQRRAYSEHTVRLILVQTFSCTI